VIGEVQPAVREKGEMVVHTRNLSYFRIIPEKRGEAKWQSDKLKDV